MPSQAQQVDLEWLEQLTPEEAAQLLTEAEFYEEKKSQGDSLADFIRGGWFVLEPGRELIWNWHLDVLCAYLEVLYRGAYKRLVLKMPEEECFPGRPFNRLIFNIPPGKMKSLTLVFAAAWVWTWWPEHRFLCGSNEEGLATRDSQRMRDLVESQWYQERWGFTTNDDGGIVDGTKISPRQNQKTLFMNTRRGHRESQGVFGKITGKRGDSLLWDDPHDVEKYLLGHEDVITRVCDRWSDAWSTRVNDTDLSPRVLIMQRLHQSDATAHWLKTMEGVCHVVIPYRYEEETGPGYDPEADIGRADLADPRTEEGELLDATPERAVAQAERELGPYGTAGQFQQRPAPVGGGEFKKEWLMHYTRKPQGGNRYVIVDPAGERKKTNTGQKRDNTAMGVIEACADGNLYLVDLYVDRLNLTERTKILFKWHRQYQVLNVGYKRTGFDSDIAHVREMMEMLNYRFKITPLAEKGHKNDRIRKLIPLFENAKLWLPQSLHRTIYNGETIDLIDRFIEREYSAFPVAEFDDTLDMLSDVESEELGIQFPRPQPTAPGRGTRRMHDPTVGY